MERWRSVPNYEGEYEVSSDGRIRSFKVSKKRPVTPHFVQSRIDAHGYPVVHFYSNGQRTLKKVHRLVALAFLRNRDNLPYVNHKNGIKVDNQPQNLEWVTPQQNSQHAWRAGLLHVPPIIKGDDNTNSKLTAKIVQQMRACYRPRSKQHGRRALATRYGVDPATIHAAITGRTWKHIV